MRELRNLGRHSLITLPGLAVALVAACSSGGGSSTGSGGGTTTSGSGGGTTTANASSSGAGATDGGAPTDAGDAGDAGPTTFDWVRTFGTQGGNVSGMAADSTGTVVVGQLLGSATINGKTYKATDTTAGNAFAVKLDTMGTPQWAVIDTSNVGSSIFWSVAIAKNGDILLGTHFDGSATFAGTKIMAQNYGAALVAVAPDGSKVEWSRVVAAPTAFDFPTVYGIAVDGASGAIVTTGWLSGSAKFGAKTVTIPGGATGAYLASYSPTGTIQWAEAAPKTTTSDVSPQGSPPLLAVDASGSIFVALAAEVLDNGTPASTGGKVTVNKYDATGAFQWTASGTGDGGPFFAVTGLAVDASGSPILTGTVGRSGPSAPIAATFGSHMVSTSGFAVQYPPAGGAPTWVTGIDNDGEGPLYVATAGSKVYVVALTTNHGADPEGHPPAGAYTLSDSTGVMTPGGAILATSESIMPEAMATFGSALYFSGTVLCPGTFGSLMTPAAKDNDTVLFATRVNVP